MRVRECSTLAEVNGGRPFAWLAPDLLDGLNGTARYVLAALYATARYQDSTSGMEATHVETPGGGWGAWLGASERTARRCFTELVQEGRLDRHDDGRRAIWELTESALAMRDDDRLSLRIELAPMCRPRWTCAMRAAWIALCSFARTDRGRLECFPGQAALAARAGMTRRNLQNAIYRIEAAGFVRMVRRRGTSKYVLWPAGGAPDTGQNRRIYTGQNGRIYRPESTHTLARIDTSDRPESTHELESLTGALDLSGSTRGLELRSRRVGANAPTVKSPRRLELEAEWERLQREARR